MSDQSQMDDTLPEKPDVPRRRRGRRVRLLMLLAIIAIALSIVFRSGAARPKKVILISIDTLRADHLGYMGYSRPTSPNLDRFAARSIQFRQAFSQAPSTLPSHASMFTSLYPSVHKADIQRAMPLADGFVTLAEILQSHGFHTGAFVEGAQLATLWNLDQGFEPYDVREICDGEEWLPDDLEGILARATAWIELNRDKPFFCFIHSYVVHFPYTPRPPYDRMFGDTHEAPLLRAMTYKEFNPNDGSHRSPDDAEVRNLIALYDGEISYADALIGDFIEHLRVLGIDDETVVVFLSDHGEEFGEHGAAARHVHTLFDELLHVPLLIRAPGEPPRRIDRQVRLIDLAPTLLGILKINDGNVLFQGRDLLAHTRDEERDLPVFSEFDYPSGRSASLRADGYKLLMTQGNSFSLFDLRTDPREQENLFESRPETGSVSLGRIREIMAENEVLATHNAIPIELDPETERQLRALGYLD